MLHGRNSNVRPFEKETVSTFLPTAIVCLMQVCPAEQPNKGNVRWLLRTDCDVSTKKGRRQWKTLQRWYNNIVIAQSQLR